MGATEDEVEEILGDGREDEAFGVWPENARAVEIFLAVRRCWRSAPLGGVVGYDYPNLESRLRMMKVRNIPEMVDLLEPMLDAALEILAVKDE